MNKTSLWKRTEFSACRENLNVRPVPCGDFGRFLRKAGVVFLILGLGFMGGCSSPASPQAIVLNGCNPAYDIREGLTPKRLTVAMWDASWINGHYPDGPYEDFDRSMDELIERGFNTVRIDPRPLILDQMALKGETAYVVGAEPMATWGLSTREWSHDIAGELIGFMKAAKRKGIYVILSSWGSGEKSLYTKFEDFWRAWERVLDLLKNEDLLSHVLYVDFDQEFPYFSPFLEELDRLGKEPSAAGMDDAAAMEAAGRADLNWNSAQLRFVKRYFSKTLSHFQRRYPQLRFTFSLTSFWEEVRSLNLKNLDVLELHIWIHGDRFENRTGFNALEKDRDPKRNYQDYMQRIRATMQSVRPMLIGEIHNKLAFARDWSREIPAPLVVTESWGPWWHMDHPDLEWDWLYEWCEQCMGLSAEYGFWGSTPWNYCHPYWENWSNVKWYRKVNGAFLSKRCNTHQ